MNHWIALYLSGQYPGYYKLPNRFDVLFKIKQLDSTNFNDSLLSLLQNKGDLEFYNTLLETFQEIHPDQYEDLLNRLNIPQKVKLDPYESKSTRVNKLDLKKLEKYLDDVKETEFSRLVVMPILQAMGYMNVEYKGKVDETDFGTDFYVLEFKSPADVSHFAGVQVKSESMTNGDTSNSGSALNKLISEVNTAFSHPHRLNTGEEVYISEMLIFNSKKTSETAKEKLFQDRNLKDKKIKFLAKEGIMSLLSKLEFKKEFFAF